MKLTPRKSPSKPNKPPSPPKTIYSVVQDMPATSDRFLMLPNRESPVNIKRPQNDESPVTKIEGAQKLHLESAGKGVSMQLETYSDL